jgi:hypothetical protein
MKRFTRGTTVDFSTTFYDAAGAVAQPDTATLTISYPPDGWPVSGASRKKAEIDMDYDSDTGKWTAEWSTAVSGPGIVYYHMRSSDPDLTSEDGRFEVIANFANLEVEDDD